MLRRHVNERVSQRTDSPGESRRDAVIMASMRKIKGRAETAYTTYRTAAAAVVTSHLDLTNAGVEPSTSEDHMRLVRRAGAYHAQWLAAERRVEENAGREEDGR
jgi:hypothetical protein